MENYKIDPTIEFDVIELPSKGIFYDNNKKTLKVSYLTAYDENILSSPNLIKDNKVIDELIRRKVLDKDINVSDLVEEDKQAILIFLRNTAFGTDYTFKLKDEKTDKDFSVVVDLSTLKIKDFDLVADENGEFPYFMEKSKTKITFKFLDKKQEEEIEKLKNESKEGTPPFKTRELEFMIKSVNGNRDLMAIHFFVEKLPIKDAMDFREYIRKNRPGIDLTKTVTTPSGENIQLKIGFGVEFFRPFYGI